MHHPGSLPVVDWLPAAVVAFGAVVALGSAQGGYFPTSWGPAVFGASAILILWLAVGARTDAGWRDVALVVSLALFAAWIGLSTLWSAAPALSILEFQRILVVLLGTSAVLVLSERGAETYLAFAIMAGVTVVAAYALATRMAPGQLADFDPSDGYRLSAPIGYWNGLGTFTAMGLVLAIGVAVGASSRLQRIVASIALVVLAPTLYFTYSRGAAAALVCGIAVMFAVTPRRIATLGSLLLLAVAPIIAVVAAARMNGLTNATTSFAEAASDGHTMMVVLALLAVLAGGVSCLIMAAETRITVSDPTRRWLGTGAVVTLVILILMATVAAGGPSRMAHRALRGFNTLPSSSESNLNDHLLTLSGSGRVDLWRVALSAYRGHPVLGIGAGAFERYWLRDPRAMFKARDAHSVYLETLTELGPVGLAILLSAVAVILSSGIAARRNPIVPGALAAFVVYAAHAAVEWDWELTGVTLTAFLAGSTCVVARRRSTTAPLGRSARLCLGAAVAGVALIAGVGYVGNEALSQGQQALDRGKPALAVSNARLARRWAPWSPYPPTVLGEGLLQLGDTKGAAAAFDDALAIDRGYWRAWLGLAVASSGPARKHALEQASRNYVNSQEIYETVLLLRKQGD